MALELLSGGVLLEAQKGFAVGSDGEDLTSDEPDAWKPHCLVVATTADLGDRVADSLLGFGDALALVDEAAGGPTTPVQIEERPLPDDELDRLVARIRERSPGADDWFRRSFFRYGEACPRTRERLPGNVSRRSDEREALVESTPALTMPTSGGGRPRCSARRSCRSGAPFVGRSAARPLRLTFPRPCADG